MKNELRLQNSGQFEVRSNADGTKGLRGIAAPFNSLSVPLGGFRERIQPGAFAESLKSNDIRALFDHNWANVLGRTPNTLQLRETNAGLTFDIPTLPKTQLAADLTESISRGDISGVSFGFNVPDGGDDWAQTDDGVVRTLRTVNLMEISVVSNPAYPQTSVNLRSAPAEIRSLLDDILGDDDDDSDDDDIDPLTGKKKKKSDEDDDTDDGGRSRFFAGELAVILAKRRMQF